MTDLDEIRNEYFNWLCHSAIDNPKQRDNMSLLLTKLYDLDFAPILERDYNRWNDGVDVRYRFAWEREYAYSDVDDALIERRCSMLELLVSLSFLIEDRYMADGLSQVPIWFMQMIESLGLSEYTNDYFYEEEIERKVERFINREYDYNGKGGLFTIENPTEDQRNIEIWRQLTNHCSEMLKFSLKL